MVTATPQTHYTTPAEARRVLAALELDRAEIGFDVTAAGILGRIYDLGHASTSDLAEWFQTADEWIAFSRLQRCRFVEDLGTQFTLSREGYDFVVELLAEGNQARLKSPARSGSSKSPSRGGSG